MNAIEKGMKDIHKKLAEVLMAGPEYAHKPAEEVLLLVEQTAKAYAVEELEKMRRNPLGAIRHDVENRIKELNEAKGL